MSAASTKAATAASTVTRRLLLRVTGGETGSAATGLA
jgi:hypothetical protein